MKKIGGIILSLAGLAIIAVTSLPSLSKRYSSALPGFIEMKFVVTAGVILVILGVILTMNNKKSSKVKHAAEEVPIYHGEGKHRRIVGYRKA